MNAAVKTLILAVFAAAAATGTSAKATAQPLPWIFTVTGERSLPTLNSIWAEAQVTVSDGTSFDTIAFYQDHQRAVFRQVYSDRTVTYGVEGKYFWSFDGTQELEAPPFAAGVVLGHQLHAQILYFDKLHTISGQGERGLFQETPCRVVKSEDWQAYYLDNGTLLGMSLRPSPDDPLIEFAYKDWEDMHGLRLPKTVVIDDGTRVFTYDFGEVRFNFGSLDALRAPYLVLTEEQRLIRLHRVAMDAHWSGDLSVMNQVWADSVTELSRGQVNSRSGEEYAGMFEAMMSGRDYTVYDDLIRPLVVVSEDGTLGWVMVQVEAEGFIFDDQGRAADPFDFVCAWVELYKKQNGEWRMAGNVSNFLPAGN